MSLRLKVFIIGSCVVTLFMCAIFLFIPKQKAEIVIDAPLSQPMN